MTFTEIVTSATGTLVALIIVAGFMQTWEWLLKVAIDEYRKNIE